MSLQTRRQFSQRSLAVISGAASLTLPRFLGAAGKPDSKVAGVQIGLNVPYSFGGKNMGEDEVLRNCVALGLSGVELRTQPVEAFLGLKADLVETKKDKGGSAAKGKAEKVREWRKSVSMDRVKPLRAKWEDAGVLIEIVKVDGIFKMSDDELDYVFALARALGGRAISTEISHDEAELKRVGQFADKHRFPVGYHGHATTKPEHWEAAFALARFNGANVDLGHFVAGNNASPVPFLEKYHDRVTHVHVKDRRMNNGPNTPLGEGDTPIKEVLRLIRDRKWNMQATIEFEYKVPEGSDRMKEIGRCVTYCRDALA